MAQDLPDLRAVSGATQTRSRRNWGDLRLRLASAAILAPAALACIWAGGLAWAALILAGMGGLGLEWGQLCAQAESKTVRTSFFAKKEAKKLLFLTIVPMVLAGLLGLAGRPAYGAVALALAWTGLWRHARVRALGLLYIGLASIALIWLRADPLVGRANVLWLILVVWATDIGAYLAGRMLGGPKLAPRISPGKTWSGAAGGLAAAMLVGTAIAPRAAAAAAALSIAAQAGDLLESGIKRHFGVKDSGRLIPGHGGLLDRLDGVLAAALLAAAMALGMGRGVLIWR